jgi:hypothetical protein
VSVAVSAEQILERVRLARDRRRERRAERLAAKTFAG